MTDIIYQKIVQIDRLINEFCKQYTKYKLSISSWFRSYDTGGYITINRNLSHIRIDYKYEDNSIILFEDSEYSPLITIKNIQSFFDNKDELFTILDNFLYKFIDSKLKLQRKTIFTEILFSVFDDKCSNTINKLKKRKRDDFSDVYDKYYKDTVEKQLWIENC
jgi:hypothetical protein